ncbi:hypothetical protein MMSP_2327 [Mycobacterium sp. 012931]|nr:hypothetical protein MMSP_2327 [Mycobacterium sp. 012931]
MRPRATVAAATPTTDLAAGRALITPRRRNFIFVALVLGILLSSLDQTIVAIALPTIVADLGEAGRQSWVVTSYLLASTIATALVGKLGDMFGRKRVFQVRAALCGGVGVVWADAVDDHAGRIPCLTGRRRRRHHRHRYRPDR